MRCTDAVLWSQEPLKGVSSGMIPCALYYKTNAGIQCPCSLSSTSSRRKAGSAWGKVMGALTSACQRLLCTVRERIDHQRWCREVRS
jgi:hypothetical protein